ncbi:hypothetical protein [Lysobacter enzymogenes]|uniref:Uncharacterized protein n=1 Tax=Lysobacter enzymogenes TaxID=69 RepID=A0A3N2RPL4_LYSEN|nr:hypothetical protein [Lysobacter enzymogenes]ROU09410.1 hypothetical protein D9T17_00845 [Lysobacter enzymogenes]
MFDPEVEEKLFLAGTANFNLNVVEGEAYARWRLSLFDALGLLRPHFDADCAQWYEVARQAAHRPMDALELKPTRDHIVEYRRSQLGLDKFHQYYTEPMDALTRVFMFALETWPECHRSMMVAGIGQDIDTVADIILEHFGHGRELVEILEKRYKP